MMTQLAPCRPRLDRGADVAAEPRVPAPRQRPTPPPALPHLALPRLPHLARRALPALREVALLGALYLGYTLSRLFASDDLAAAQRHATQVLHVEQLTGLDVERVLNSGVGHVQWLEVGTAYWYALLHYLVTPLVLVLLWRRGPSLYRPARRALVLATSVALIGYLTFPTAPPRLLGGYTDVLSATSTWGWWGADASAPRGLGGATNELAAMPSMHVGWAVWVAVVLVGLARRRWQRVAAYGYAAGTAFVVVATANHWVLDGLVGAVVMLAALVVTGATPGARQPDPDAA